MTVPIWGIKDPGDFVCKKIDNKWRTRYVDFKMFPKADSTFRVKFRSLNGNYAYHSVKKRKSR